jgi:glutathione S-transferase
MYRLSTNSLPQSSPPELTYYRLYAHVLAQWNILDQRLSLPDQKYIAVPDRSTLADLSYFPFAMPWMFNFLGVDIKDWPNIESWSERTLSRPAIMKVLERAPIIAHEEAAV